jgi:hypothetical protein
MKAVRSMSLMISAKRYGKMSENGIPRDPLLSYKSRTGSPYVQKPSVAAMAHSFLQESISDLVNKLTLDEKISLLGAPNW